MMEELGFALFLCHEDEQNILLFTLMVGVLFVCLFVCLFVLFRFLFFVCLFGVFFFVFCFLALLCFGVRLYDYIFSGAN